MDAILARTDMSVRAGDTIDGVFTGGKTTLLTLGPGRTLVVSSRTGDVDVIFWRYRWHGPFYVYTDPNRPMRVNASTLLTLRRVERVRARVQCVFQMSNLGNQKPLMVIIMSSSPRLGAQFTVGMFWR